MIAHDGKGSWRPISIFNKLLRTLSWVRIVILSASVLFLGKILGKWVWPDQVNLRYVAAGLGAIVLLKLISDLPAGYGRAHKLLKNKGRWSDAFIAFLPLEIGALIKLDRSLANGFYGWVRRVEIPPPKHTGDKISFWKESQYQTIFVIILIACLADIPITALIAGAVQHDAERRNLIHLFILAVTCYALVWILGDRWLVKASYHVLTDKYFHLSVGSRYSADIPLSRIFSAKVLSETPEEWRKKFGVDQRDISVVCPISADRPNLLLELSDGPEIPIEKFKLMTSAPRYLLVFVDQPALVSQTISCSLSDYN